MYRMLDLFSGLCGASSAMLEDPNWEVITVDIVKKFNPTICKDILQLDVDELPYLEYDLVWASPPCIVFSPANYFRCFEKQGNVFLPKVDEAVSSIALVFKTLRLINELKPKWWYMENPRGILHKFIGDASGWVSYCQYGDTAMKPTNLWGNHPPSFEYKHCWMGAPCHDAAPRGSMTGTQAKKNPAERALVPYLLSKSVKEAVENPAAPNLFDYMTVDKQTKRID